MGTERDSTTALLAELFRENSLREYGEGQTDPTTSATYLAGLWSSTCILKDGTPRLVSGKCA